MQSSLASIYPVKGILARGYFNSFLCISSSTSDASWGVELKQAEQLV